MDLPAALINPLHHTAHGQHHPRPLGQRLPRRCQKTACSSLLAWLNAGLDRDPFAIDLEVIPSSLLARLRCLCRMDIDRLEDETAGGTNSVQIYMLPTGKPTPNPQRMVVYVDDPQLHLRSGFPAR